MAGKFPEPGWAMRERYRDVPFYLWAFLLLPGQLITWLQYMFPPRGQLWASRRRLDSGVIHFMFSIGFYVGLLMLSASAFRGR